MPVPQWLNYNPGTGVLSYFDGTSLVAIPLGDTFVSATRDGPGTASINTGTWTATDASPPTGGLTVPEAGRYLVLATSDIFGTIATGEFELGFSINGADPTFFQDHTGQVDIRASFAIHDEITLAANDTIELSARRASGTGTLNLVNRRLTYQRVGS